MAKWWGGKRVGFLYPKYKKVKYYIFHCYKKIYITITIQNLFNRTYFCKEETREMTKPRAENEG